MNDRSHGRWPPLTYIWAAAFGIVAGLYLIQFALQTGAAIFVVLLFGILFSLVLVYPINLLGRVMPRWLAAVLTLCLVLGLIALAVYVSMPFFVSQSQWLVAHVPLALERAQSWLHSLNVDGHPLPGSVKQHLTAELGNLVKQALPVAFGAVSALGGMTAVLALSLFLAYDADAYRRGILRLVPRASEHTLEQFLDRAGRVLQHWMVGQLLSMTVTGVLTGLGLLLLGINSWLVLGAIAFVLEFVPYIGPILSAVPGVATGFAISPSMALWVLVVYVVVQLVESNVLQPLIMKRAIQLQPALQLVWQLAMGSAFGILGLFIATPLLACIQLAVEYFYIERTLEKPAS